MDIQAYVGITDRNWIDEVNFWRPSDKQQFKVLQPGELFLFKLHSPVDYIVGGWVFVYFNHFPINIDWESFGISN